MGEGVIGYIFLLTMDPVYGLLLACRPVMTVVTLLHNGKYGPMQKLYPPDLLKLAKSALQHQSQEHAAHIQAVIIAVLLRPLHRCLQSREVPKDAHKVVHRVFGVELAGEEAAFRAEEPLDTPLISAPFGQGARDGDYVVPVVLDNVQGAVDI